MGWKISEIGFGAWAIGGDMWGPQDDRTSISALHAAIDRGVNFIDTAQGYGKGHSEELIGKVLRERPEEIYVATKVPPVPGTPWPPPENQDPNISFPADYIIKACEGSLRRLKRDHIDIYQFHTWATAFNIYDEWHEAMQQLKQDGKIRATGVSVHDTTPDSVIGSLVNDRVDAVQVIYNLFEQYPDWNLLPVCRRMNTAVIVRVPFDEGALTGKFTGKTSFPEGDVRRHYFRGNNLSAVIKKVEEIREHKNSDYPAMPMAGFALRFCLSNNAVGTVIPGIRNIRQAEENTSVSDGVLFDIGYMECLGRFAWLKEFWHKEVEVDM